MKTQRTRLAAFAGGIAVASVVTACTSGTHESSGGGSGASKDLTIMTPAATSDVDKVTWDVFEGEPQSLDPYKSADYNANMVNSNMCENLLWQTPDFQIKPNLAESFENPDPLHWVYTLRDDVKFWDGSPMTAEDVAWSMNHNLSDETTFYHYLYSNVADVKVTGEHEVTVTLAKPDYLFNEELANYAGVVVKKDFFLANPDTFGSPSGGLMCTGPFVFKKWDQGQSVTMTRNPDYWNKDLQPKVKTLVFTFLSDSSAITNGLLAGQLDGVYGVPPSGMSQLKNSTLGNLYQGPAPLEVTIVYANPAGPMSDLTMRKALQIAIDWDGIAKNIYKTTAERPKLQTPPTSFGFADKELQEFSDSLPARKSAQYDEAKKLVAQAPAAVRSKPITMVVPDQAETQQLGTAIKDAATRIGLNFNLKVVPATAYTNYLYDPQTRAGVDILYTQFWPNIPNPLDWIGITSVKGGSFNQYGYSGVDEPFAEAQATADEGERAKLVVDIEKTLNEQLLPMVPGVQIDNTVWMNKRITGVPASFNYVYYPWAAHLGGTGK
jgi:peptide/nickel transport system substrate-binding protein